MLKIIVIIDTICLIALAKINVLHLLQNLCKHVVITEEIYAEFGNPLPDWIEIRQVSDKKYQQLLETTLDKGEASAIALAMELKNVLLVIDDLKGSKKAEQLGLDITGTLGILFRMKQMGILSALKPYFEQLEIAGFRIMPAIMEVLLKESGEI